MKKYYIIVKTKYKPPTLLLNSEDEKEQGKKDRVLFWYSEKEAKEQLKQLKEEFRYKIYYTRYYLVKVKE